MNQHQHFASVSFNGHFYDGLSSRSQPVHAEAHGGTLHCSIGDAADRREVRFESVQVTIAPRLGNTTRGIRLPDEAKIETADNDAVDALERLWGKTAVRAHMLESHWGYVALGLLALGAFVAATYVWGIPLAARHIANSIPDKVAYQMGEGTLGTLDKFMFKPSKLTSARQGQLREGFALMAKNYPKLPLHLEFRQAGMPNAFALPNGTVVVTDELLDVVEGDDEVYAVLAHEIGHVEHRHTARMALESSAVSVIVMLVFGDASQAAGIAASLPAIYANAAFSRELETEADTFALQYMKRTGQDPESFARALEHLTADQTPTKDDNSAKKKSSKPESSVLRYMASHPATSERIARFRKAR